ncbi:transposase [Actinacidiphila glaucinigra]|uniref:transposase n=1 Tax=Actinacidiphila glaucinigra TaxID=235986 RepID=UPI0032492DE7
MKPPPAGRLRRAKSFISRTAPFPEAVPTTNSLSCSGHKIWDNLAGHHSRWMQRSIDGRDWLTVHYLPAYAPDLNPVEQVWSHLKRTALANLAALTLDELTRAVRTGLRRIQNRPALLTACLTHTGLEIHSAPT